MSEVTPKTGAIWRAKRGKRECKIVDVRVLLDGTVMISYRYSTLPEGTKAFRRRSRSAELPERSFLDKFEYARVGSSEIVPCLSG